MSQQPIFTGSLLRELETIVSRYPDSRSATLPALHLAQRAAGELNDAIKTEVATRLGLTPAFVESVASFYSLYLDRAAGEHVIHVCTTLSCMLNGADDTVDRLREVLGIDIGGTTPDRRHSLFITECLGACQHAPVARVDGAFRFGLTAARVEELLAELESAPKGSPSPDIAPEFKVATAAVEADRG